MSHQDVSDNKTATADAARGARKGRVRMQGVVKRHGSFTALHGIDLAIEPGEFFALLGPSGSGKTTTLRILAGLESVNEGRVLLDDDDVTQAQPGERDVAMVFQSYALYPHMTVGENIAFPLKMIRTPRATIEIAVKQAAEKVGIGHLLARRPGQLSGGQQQRCALARAIVRKPRLFLLDEPLSNLDAKLRVETRAELRRLQRSLATTAVYVTHDQEEAMTVADRMAVFMEGRIVQVGRPQDIFARPASSVVAGFIGTPPMNLMPAMLDGNVASLLGARLPVVTDQPTSSQARPILLGVRPGDLRLAPQGIPARVEFVEDLGDTAFANLLLGNGDDGGGGSAEQPAQRVKVRLERGAPATEGQTVRLGFDPASAHVFDRASGARM